jgi:trehalose-6-phosphate synthase
VQSYPEAQVIRVVLDNLNTHKAASLYAAFSPEVLWSNFFGHLDRWKIHSERKR